MVESVIDIFNLFKGAVISVESHRGKKEVWVSIGGQHFPLVIRPTSAKKQRSGLSGHRMRSPRRGKLTGNRPGRTKG